MHLYGSMMIVMFVSPIARFFCMFFMGIPLYFMSEPGQMMRTYRSAGASGGAIETEFQILNTLLAENVVVTYPQRFELHDRRADLDFLVRAKEVTAKTGSPTLQREIERQLARVVLERNDVLEVVEGELLGG